MDVLSTTGGAKALAETAGVRTLDDRAILRVTGDDARAWLNGQITNDVALSEPGRATYALVVNLKGRVLTDLWALDREDRFDLVLPADRRDAIAEHFDRYIIMEDVELEPVDDAAVVTVQGPRAPQVAAEADAADAWPCPRLGTEGRDVVVPRSELQAAVEALAGAAAAAGGGLVSPEAWALARLRAGVPEIGVDFGDFTYPQEAGLGDRALSFTKGCYQGQEAVIMLEHRGKPPKRLAHLLVEADTPPAPQTPITNADGRPVGELTSAAADPETPGRCPALGYLKRAFATVGQGYRVGEAPVVVRKLAGE